MFRKLNQIGRMRVSVMQALAVLSIVFFIVAGAFAATGSGTVDFLARTLYAKYLKPLRMGQPPYWLYVQGDIDKSGCTETPSSDWVAILSGTTGDVKWTTATLAGVTPSLTTNSGESGWFLTPDILKKYKVFYVEDSFPVANYLNGVTAFSDKCPAARAKRGVTIYVCDMTEELKGKSWTFIKAPGTGVTPFVIHYARASGIVNVVAGTSQAPSAGGFVNGATTIPERPGDNVELRAYANSNTSGYVVTRIVAGRT